MRVPPPSTLKVRKPKSYAEANTIIGDQPNKVKRYDHEMVELDLRKHPITGRSLGDGELVIVLENKTTLGLEYTSNLSKHQRKGGAANTKRVMRDVRRRKKGYSKEALSENNQDYKNALRAYDEAEKNGSLIYLHSQIFLEQSGALRTSVGNGSGFQLNLWF